MACWRHHVPLLIALFAPAEEELAARRLTGSQAGTSGGSSGLVDDEGEAFEGEDEDEFDEFDEDEDSPDLKYPEVPTRIVQLYKLLDGAFAEDLADSVRGEEGPFSMT
jgi:hypothetical protein